MLWQRSEPPTSPHQRPPSIPDSDFVRQAALQASWRRDRRVAQRRIAWRWIVWYVQRFTPHVLVGSAVVTLAAYFTGFLPSWSSIADRPAASENVPARAPYSPPAVPTLATNAPTNPAEQSVEQFDQPLNLRSSLALGIPLVDAQPPAAGAIQSPDTLSLKPESWLHSKEP